MWPRATLIGALAFIVVAAAAPALPGLAGVAGHHRLRQRAGRARARDPVAGRPRALRTGAVLRDRRLCGGAARPLRRLDATCCSWSRSARLRPACVAFLVGFLLARYRDIFFAMLSLAMSMILYGVLVKTETLGSTDGFHVESGDVPRLRAARPCAQSRAVLAGAGAVGGQRVPGHALFPHRRRRAGGAGARQRDPLRVPRHLGHPPDPPQAGDRRDARRLRRRARGARGRRMSIPTWRIGRPRAASCSSPSWPARARSRPPSSARWCSSWCARSPSMSCPAPGRSSSARRCC